MQTGVDPLGHTINPETMPWQNYSAAFTAEELAAVYGYIRGLTPSAASSP
jgi:hypothetical protein